MLKDRLKELRKENKLTQDDLSAKLNISRQSVSKWENGISYPTRSMIYQLSEIFNVNINDLLNSEEIMMISIDNNKKVIDVEKRNIIILLGIVVLMISIVIVAISFNHRINQIEEPIDYLEEETVEDQAIGYIILDDNENEIMNLKGMNSIEELIDSNLYPYFIYDNRGDVFPVSKTNLVNCTLTKTNQDSITNYYEIYIQKCEYIIYWPQLIMRRPQDDTLYLQPFCGCGMNYFATRTTFTFSTMNNVENVVSWNFFDEFEKTEIYQYDEKNELISINQLPDALIYNLNIDTLYFVIRETYKDYNGNEYINKIYVDYTMLKEHFHYIFKIKTDNNFMKYRQMSFQTYT